MTEIFLCVLAYMYLAGVLLGVSLDFGLRVVTISYCPNMNSFVGCALWRYHASCGDLPVV